MRRDCASEGETATEIECRIRQGTDRFVRPPIYAVCKALWPHSTDAEIASILGCSVRNGARYLSGELETPGRLIATIVNEITRR